LISCGTLKSAKSKKKLMKQQTKWLASALAVASVLVVANSAQAQYVTGDQFLDNVTVDGGETGVTVTDGPNGLEIVAPAGTGYEFGNIDLTTQQQPAGTFAGDTKVIFTYTINSPTPTPTGDWSWTGITILLAANGGSDERYPGSGYDSPFLTYGFPNGQGVANTDPGYSYNPANQQVTQVANLDATTLAGIASGTITQIQLSFDPTSTLPNGYDITFNSIELVPEPATLALIGLGLAGLLVVRRHKAVN
jgi:PEP-CTERM motif